MVWFLHIPGNRRNGDQGILWDMIAGERLNDIFHIGEILKRKEFMGSRMARQLPMIDIGGTMFYLDLRLNEFREVENFANRINLDDLYETATGQFKLWFDKATKNLFLGTPEEFAANKKVVEITLPTQQEMDPLGFVWIMEDQHWIGPLDAKIKTEQLLKEYNIHERTGMVMQRKPKEHGLLEKRKNQRTKQRGKKL